MSKDSIDLQTFRNNFKALGKQLESNNNSIDLDTLFTKQFMESNTKFSSFFELLHAGNLNINTPDEFDQLSDEVLNKIISDNTKFASWDEMSGEAFQTYFNNQIFK